jgi:hypothetical protein
VQDPQGRSFLNALELASETATVVAVVIVLTGIVLPPATTVIAGMIEVAFATHRH